MKQSQIKGAIDLARHFNNFLEQQREKKSEHTLIGYREAMRLFVTYLQDIVGVSAERLDISLFSIENIGDFMSWLREVIGDAPKTCNLRLSQLTAFLKYMSRDPRYMMQYASVRGMVKYIVEDTSKTVEPLTKNAVKAILHAPGTDTVTGLRYTTLMSMLYSMAARIGEIIAIKVGDIIFDAGKPHVTVMGKGKRARTIYIPKKTVALLKKYIKAEHGASPVPDAYLFYSHSKGLYAMASERGINKQLLVYAEQARKNCPEVPEKVHSHQFRHSMATHSLDDGMNVFQISKMLGHKSVETTMIYLGVTIAMKDSAIKQIESTTAQVVKPRWTKTGRLKELF